jgi:hypothetical protein
MVPSSLSFWWPQLVVVAILDLLAGGTLGLVTTLLARRIWPYPARRIWICAGLGGLGFIAGQIGSFLGPTTYHVYESPGSVTSIRESIFVPYWYAVAAATAVCLALVGTYGLARAARRHARAAA